MTFDCIIVGGGFAGLQAAIQLGRYRHRVAVVDAAEGRSVLCRRYQNLIGWPDGVSGRELRAAGKRQAERLGVRFIEGMASEVVRSPEGFAVTLADRREVQGARLLLATGVKDRLPDFPALIPCLGISAFICPDCDGYEVSDRHTLVLGAGKPGANMALTLTHWTSSLIYVNHELAPLDEELRGKLAEKGIEHIERRIKEVRAEESRFAGVELEDGRVLAADRCFLAFGGNEVRSGLAGQLNAKITENRHIAVDPRTKETSVKHVWAAGDVTTHSEMVTIAMGDGSQAAIWIHKSLIEGSE